MLYSFCFVFLLLLLLLFVLVCCSTRIHSHPYVLAHVIHYSYHTHALQSHTVHAFFPFLTYRSIIFTSSFSHAVFLSRSFVRSFFFFFFEFNIVTYYRDFSLRICRPIFYYFFFCLFVCLFFCLSVSSFVKVFRVFYVSFLFLPHTNFSSKCNRDHFVFIHIFSLSLFLFVYLFFVFRFVIKNVHLLRLNCRQLFKFFLSLSFFKIQQHTIRIWLYRCSLALQLKRVSYEGLTVHQWRCRHLD